MGMMAIEEYLMEVGRRTVPSGWTAVDDFIPDVDIRNDDEAKNIADTPHLTGDPEWDAIELQETALGKDRPNPAFLKRGGWRG